MMSLIRRFWHNLPLASKIALFTSVLVVLIVPTLTILTIQRERAIFRYELEEQANLLLDTVSERLRDPLINEHIDEIDEIARDIIEHDEITRFKVYNKNGVLKVDADQPEKDIPVDTTPLNPDSISQAMGRSAFYWKDELVAEMGVWTKGERIGFVQMGFSIEPLNERIRALTEWSFTLVAVALVVGILLAALMARQLTNPIHELTRIAKKMTAGDLGTRFQPRGNDEIGQLGCAFNDLTSAIEKRETDLRNLARSLEQTVKERTGELQQKNQYLAALHEVTLGLIQNLDVEQLLEAIMTRAASLVNAEHAFVNILDPEQGDMELCVAQGRYRTHLGMRTKVNQGLSGRVVVSGQMMIENDYQQFEDKHPEFDWLRTAIYIPLRSESALLGVIGLGYDRVVPVNPNHIDILNQFAQLASLALKNAQLYSATRRELSETEQALLAEEERRKAYLLSPQGRAESVAESILKDPAQALIALHNLTQMADQDANAMILTELPGVMEQAGHPLLARLAEGYHFLYRSHSEPELLAVGLRQLRTALDLPEAKSLLQVDEAVAIYELCYQAVEARNTHAITELLPSLQAFQFNTEPHSIFSGLADALKALLPVAESLHAYERVDTTEDRRDYLARAVEGLSHVDRLAHGLQAAERPIAGRIVGNWIALVTLSMSDLQTRAQISCRLLSRHSWKDEMVAVALQLRNEGRGMALNLRVSLARSQDYTLADDLIEIERLAPGEETQVEFRVQPLPERDQFRAWFMILYDDPRGPNHSEHFADIVHLLAPESAFQFIPNPYIAGTPLEAGSPLFYGREDLFNFIGENLNAAYRNNLVLIGQRRTGKSSLLKQLPLRLGDSYLPVYLDGQSIALDPGLPAFFSNLATEIGFALQDRGFDLAIPVLDEFRERPAHTFEYDYLRRVWPAIGNRHMVLLLDEFEELEAAVKSGNLDASIFGFLRHIIQHESRLSVIFCGTHRMEELATDYWNVLFNISLYKHIGFLDYDDAERLIQEPVAAYGMRYDDLALDKMWRITAGHPYFLQLLCHSLVNQHNRAGRSYVTVSDVNTALGEILSSGEAHFIYLWNESSLTERQVLTALSRIMTLTGHVMPVQVEDYLNERGIPLDRQVIAETLHHLTLRDILALQVDSQTTGIAGTYGWRLGLLGLWIEKYKSLSLLQEEAWQ
jgi:HAMP domain-containing protein/GAF domain-containing protein